MSATYTLPATLDVSRTPRVPLNRLVRVELRKMIDTRAGMWLLIAMVAISVVWIVVSGFTSSAADKTFSQFMSATGIPQGFLLPVLGILLITQEWSQRTAIVTFTQEPNRARALSAKIYAALLIGFIAMAIAMVVAAVAAVIFGGGNGFDGTGGLDFAKFGLLEVFVVLQGLSFGLLFLNSPAAIVLYYVVPTAVSVLTGSISALHGAGDWVNPNQFPSLMASTGNLSGEQWAQAAVIALIWVVIPFGAGMWRVLRAELK